LKSVHPTTNTHVTCKCKAVSGWLVICPYWEEEGEKKVVPVHTVKTCKGNRGIAPLTRTTWI